jgi:hypothetical protein
VDHKNDRSCSSCFFSEEFPGIKIEEDGKCNFCNHNDFQIGHRGQAAEDMGKLHSIAKELKKQRKGKYDCIIGASGGLDSSYVIYIARRILGLNPLVIKYDHGFNYDIATDNLEAICNKLQVDLEIIRSAKEYDRKYVRFMVLALRDIDAYWGVCSFCHYILPAVIYKYALEENISTILHSSNLYEKRLYLKRDFKLRFMLRNLSKLGLLKLLRLVFYAGVAQCYLIGLKLEFYVPPISNVFRHEAKKPSALEWVDMTRYIKWDIDQIVETMGREIGWKRPDKPKLPMRFDCKIEESLINHTYKKAIGLTVHGIICNNLIYDGARTKSELEDTVEHYDHALTQAMQQILSDLEIG